MSERRTEFRLEEMCRVFAVFRSGYYRWIKRRPSKRELDNQRLRAQIGEIFTGRMGRYGSPKITREHQDRGKRVGKNRVARRIRQAGLRSKILRKYRVTTDTNHQFTVSPNLLQRNFTAQAPNQAWVSDIAYQANRTGWLYLTVIIDLLSRLVIGLALCSSLSHEMVIAALKRAIRRRFPGKGLIYYSDREVQYACTDFRKELEDHGFIYSISQKAECWDKTVAESFFLL